MQRSETNQTCVMDEDEIERTLVRMAHQILEQNKGCENLALVGILTRGDILARKLADIIYSIEAFTFQWARSTSASIATMPRSRACLSSTGRYPVQHRQQDHRASGRCALHRAHDPSRARCAHGFGRPARIQLAILVDRVTANFRSAPTS